MNLNLNVIKFLQQYDNDPELRAKVEQAEMMGLFPVAPEDEKIYVATVPDKVHGAGVLAY